MRSLDYMNRVEAYVNRLNSERRTVLETIPQVRFLDLMADELIILTSVDMVYKNFGKEDQEGISSMTVAEAQKYIEEGQFGATDMLPKIEAAIAYLAKKPDGQVLITSLAQTNNALKGKTGTIITA